LLVWHNPPVKDVLMLGQKSTIIKDEESDAD